VYASAQALDFLARTKIFRLKAVSGMTRLSLLSEQKPRGAWSLSRCFQLDTRLSACGVMGMRFQAGIDTPMGHLKSEFVESSMRSLTPFLHNRKMPLH